MTPTLAHRIATEWSIGMPVLGDCPVGVGESAGVGGDGDVGGPDVATVTSIEVTEFLLGRSLEQATELLVGVLAVLEPSRLTGPDALRLYEQFAGVERLGMSGKTLLAPRIDESDVYRDHGHRNTAALLADI